MRGRISLIIKVLSLGLWGSGKKYLEADIVTTKCKHLGYGKYVVCIPSTYLKGLIRRNLEKILGLLSKFNIVNVNIVNELLRVEGVDVLPSPMVIGSAFPIKEEVISELVNSPPFTYMLRSDVIAHVDLIMEPHIRILDTCNRVSEGALYTEERVSPNTTFYSDIVLYSDNMEKLRDYIRALIIAIHQLKYAYSGRMTVSDVKVFLQEPKELLKDQIIASILR